MTLQILHAFESLKSDGVDDTLVQPSNWNEVHEITLAAGKVLGRDSSGAGAAQELALQFDASSNADFNVGKGGLGVPTGTTGERLGSPRNGTFRYNSTTNAFEGYVAGTWSGFLSSTVSQTMTMNGAAFNEAVRVDLASASTVNIAAAASNYIAITGTNTISEFGIVASGARRTVVFAGVLTLVHGGSLQLPNGGSNITTLAGDTAVFVSDGGGLWRCVDYQRVDGTALTAAAVQQTAQAYITLAFGVATVQKQVGFTSIVRDSAGRYTCTLSTPMPDANYVVLVTAGGDGSAAAVGLEDSNFARSTTVFHVATSDAGGFADSNRLNIMVYA